MKKKMKVRYKVLAFVLIFVVLTTGSMVALAASSENAQAVEENEQLAEMVQSIKERKYQVNQTKKTIAGIQSELDKAEQAIALLDAEMAETKAEIAEIEQQQIQAQAELEERLRVMYMFGSDGYIEVLFSAEDFSDFLSKVDMVGSIMQSDRDQVNNYATLMKEKEAMIADVESAKAEQEDIRKQQAELMANSQALLAQQTAEYEAELAAGEALANTFGLTLNGLIADGDYIWPIDTENGKAFYITSIFGYRTSESTNGVGSTNHGGVDITPGSGEPVYAIADATVEIASVYYGYGNCVVLNHGQNSDGVVISSLYGHLNSIACTTGDTVKQGDLIGTVGSTGNSTGPHLHFEIWENGEKVDPLGYYEQYESSFYFTE